MIPVDGPSYRISDAAAQMCIRDRTLAVPPYRVDVQRDCDVIEAILRIYGYNNVEISTTLNSSLTTKGEHDKSNKLQNLIAEQLAISHTHLI